MAYSRLPTALALLSSTTPLAVVGNRAPASQRDAWPHLLTPGMTISVRRIVQEHVPVNATRGQDDRVYVTDDNGVQYAFAYQSCKRWQVRLASL
jgi:hypothetical protein